MTLRKFTLSISIFLLFQLSIIPDKTFATTYNWTGATNTVWATTTNWSPNGNPGSASGDIVIIAPGTNQPTLSVTPAYSLASVTFSGNATLTITGVTLAVTGAVTINSSTTANIACTITGTGTLSCGSFVVGTTVIPTGTRTTGFASTINALTVTNNITINSSYSTYANNCTFTHTSGTVTAAGITTVTPVNSTSAYTMGSSSPVLQLTSATPFTIGTGGTNNMTLTGTGATVDYQSATSFTFLNSPAGLLSYRNLIISGGGGNVKTLSASTILSGTLTVRAASTLALSTYTLTTPTSITLESVGGGTGSAITGPGQLTIGGNITVNYTGSGAITTGASITAPLALGAATRTITVADDGFSNVEFTISGIISATGSYGISKAGTGALKLSGTNTISGGTLSAGTLILSNVSGLGAAGSALTISGGTLDLATDATVNAYNITVSGSSTILSDKATSSSTGINHTLGTLSIGNLTLTISGGSNVNSGVAGITFGSVTHTNTVIYTINNPANGGTTQLSLGAVSNATYLTTFKGAGNVIQTGVFGNGSGGITYSGTGTLTLNQANTFTGTLTVSSGTVVGTSNAAALGGGALILSGGTLYLTNPSGTNLTFNRNTSVSANSQITTDVTVTGAGNIYTLGTLSIGAFTLTISGGSNVNSGVAGITFGSVTHSGTLTYTINNPASGGITQLSLAAVSNSTYLTTIKGSGNVVQTGVFGNGSGGITYNGTGTLTLNQANTFTGALTVISGTVVGTSSAAALGGGTLILSGGTLYLTNPSGTNLSFNRNTTVSANSQITTDVTVTSAGNTYTLGTLSIGAFTLTITGGNNVNSGTAGVTFGAVTHTNAPTYTVNNPTNGGTAQLSIAAVSNSTFLTTFNGSGNVIQTGVFGSGSGGITYSGSGILTLNQANTFTGVLSLNSGTVIGTSNAAALGAGTLTLSGGILKLTNPSGTNLTFGRNTTVNASSQITTDVNSTGAGNTFTLGTLSVGAYSLIIAGGSNVNSGTAGITFGATTFTGTPTFTINNPAGGGTTQLSLPGVTNNANTLSINGSGNTIQTGVWGSTAGGILYSGTGTSTLTLSQANTFTSGVTINSGTLNINNANALGTTAGTFTIAGGTINTSSGAITTVNYPLSITGDFIFTGTNTLNLGTGAVSMTGDRIATISASTLTIGGPITAGTNSLTKSGAGTLSFGSNPVTLNGLTINAGTLIATSGIMYLAGNFNNSGTFTQGSGTVTFNGTSVQNIQGITSTTFNNLTLNNSSGLALGGSVSATINGTLTFTNGKISTGNNTLILGNSASVSGAGSTTYVFGNFQKGITTGTTTKTFEVGDASVYAPVALTLTSSTNSTGSITCYTTQGDHPQIATSDINPSLSVNRYWTLINNGVTGITPFNATFTFVPGDVDFGANTSNFIVQNYIPSTWTTQTVGTTSSTSTQATGITLFGDFQIGDPAAAPSPCQYSDDGSVPTIADVVPCVNFTSNPQTVSTTFTSHQYFTMNVIQGITYEVYTCNTTSPASPIMMTVYQEKAPSSPQIAFSSGNTGNPCTSVANNCYVTFTPAFSGEVRVLVNKRRDCSSVTPSGLTVIVNALGGSNTLDNQTVSGTNAWVGHIYDGTNSGVLYNGTFSNYIGYYTEAEFFDESFGGSTYCFTPVISNDTSRASIYTETFSVKYRMVTTSKGLYSVDLGSDDGSRLAIDGNLVYNNWSDQAFTLKPGVLISLTGASSLVYDYYENAGLNEIYFKNLTQILANNLTTNTIQNICLGNSGLAISGDSFGTLPTGISLSGTGYQWTYSTTPAGARTSITGATGATFTPSTAVSPFNVAGTYYVYRDAVLSSTNNVSPIPYVATNESNAAMIAINPMPSITAMTTTVCSGTGFTVTPVNGTNGIVPAGTTYSWPVPSGSGFTGGVSGSGALNISGTLTNTTNTVQTATYTVTPTAGTCTGSTFTVTITLNPIPTVTNSPLTQTICSGGNTTLVTLSSNVSGTTFAWTASATPGVTGFLANGTNTIPVQTISTTQTTQGTVTYAITPTAAGCQGSVTNYIVLVTPIPTATISYAGSPFCTSISTPQSVTINGTGAYTGGTYSSTAGLTINSGTGAITPSTSTAGTYTVTYTIPASGGCTTVPVTTSVTITALPVATFSYTGSPYCQNAANPLPTFSGGGVAGTFSSTTGLVFVSTATGQVNLAASTAGTYTITNTIAASGGCALVTASNTITITTFPAATISYAGTPFCKSLSGGQPVTRTGTAGGSYSASPAGLTIDAGTGAITPSSSTAGTYTVTYTIAASGGCGIVTATTSVTVTAIPTATINYAGSPFCTSISTPQSVTINGTGAYTGGTYSSTAGLTINSGTGAITPSTSTAGTYTVTYTIPASGGCTAVPVTTSVTITALPVATFSYTGTPYCQNASNPFPTFSGGGVAGTFSSTTGLVFVSTATGQVNLAASTAGTYTVTNTIAASGGCALVTASNTITITTLPAATISYAGTPFCQSLGSGQPVTRTGTAGGSYSASPAGLTIDAGTGAITPSSSTAGTYTVTYTIAASGGCGIVTATTSVTVTAVPTATINYAGSPFCTSISTPQSVTINGTGAYTGGTYSSTAGLTINSGTGAITPSTSTAGTYTVTYTILASGGCATVPVTTSVTITALPVATFSYTGTPYCQNASNPFPTFSGGGVAGTFSSTTGLVFVSTATGQVNLAASTAGTYTVTNTIAASGGCALVTASNTITITTLPTATISYAGTPFCQSLGSGQPVTRTGTAGGSYSASPAGLTIDAGTGAITPSSSTAGTYTVTYTIAASGGCGIVTATTSVTVTAVPTATINYAGSPFCTSISTPQSVTINGTGAYTGGTYSSTAGLTINSGTGAITPSTSTAGTYTVTYTIPASGGCTAVPVTTSVTITALPVATFSYTGTPYCQNASNPFPTFSGGGVAGTFSSTTGLVFVSTATGQVNLPASTAGTYTVTNTIAASGGCALVTASNTITITTFPAATISYAGTPFCKSLSGGQPVTRTGTAGGSYSASPAGLTIDAGTGAITPSSSTAGTYTVTYTIAASGGCGIVTATTSVTVTAIPTATINYAGSPFCTSISTPQSVTINGTGAYTGGTYSSTAGLTINSGTGAITPSTSTAGTYTVTYTIPASGGCTAVPVTTSVTITALPVATFSYTGTPYCQNASNPFPTFSGGGVAGTFSSTTGLVFVSTATGQVNLAASTAGTYTVTNTIAASGGCALVTASNTITITTLPAATISYAGTPFCQSLGSGQPVTRTGTAGGSYSASPAGLTIDAGTGAITPSSSTAGTYTVTYTIAASGGCGIVTATTSVTVTAVPTATINYAGSPFCTSISTPQSVTINGTGAYTGGTYSSTAGLTINSGTGAITPSTSTAGTYTVTYTIPASGGCTAVPVTTSVTITALPVATFSYTGTPYCQNASNPFPTFSGGGVAGTFSSTTGLVFVSTATGQVNLPASTAGTYTVTNTIAASGGCAQVIASNSITINPNLPVSVTISANPSGPICTGTSVTFTAIPTNGGTSPVYQWQKNGINVGTNSPTYTDGGLINGDIITCVLTSNATCPINNPANSNSITMIVNPILPVSVTITANPAGPICSGTNVTFTATPVNGGTSPIYQWQKNGLNVGSNSPIYSNASLANNDAIRCILTSNTTCPSGNPDTSNVIVMTVNPLMPVSIVISSNPTGPICSGTSVLFTAVPTNGGTSPSYQWKKNSVNVGTSSTTYTDAGLINGDVITCVLTSNVTCPTNNPATSNGITMTVNPTPVAPVSANANPSSIYSTYPGTIVLSAAGGGSVTGDSLKWYAGGCGSGTLIGTGNPLTIAAPYSTTTYYARWETGTCYSGCVNTTVTVLGVYKSIASGDWGNLSTWEVYTNNGLTWVPPSHFPTAADGTITIMSPNVVTISSTTGSINVDELIINAGGELLVNVCPSGYWLTILNGPGTDITVNGIMEYQDDAVQLTNGATMIVGSGGTYQHNMTYGGNYPITIPTASWDSNSTCKIIACNQLIPLAGLNQSFGNFTWAYSGQTSTINLGGALQNITGNFTIASTGSSSTLQLTNTNALTLNIGKDLIVQNGFLDFSNGAASTKIINLGGSYNQTGGTFTNSNSNPLTFNFNGSGKTFTQSDGILTSSYINWNVRTGASLAILNNLPVSVGRSCNINGTLDCGIPTFVYGSGTFNLASGGTLIIGSLNGISSSGGTGNIQTSVRNFSSGANYIYDGIATQTTGNGLPSIVSNLTINNSSNVTLTGSSGVNGTLNLSNGSFFMGHQSFTFQNSDIPILKTLGTITTDTATNLIFGTIGNTAGATFTLPSGTFTSSPTINNLTINRVNTLTLNAQPLSLRGVLLCNGPLNTNNNLTLLSTATQTALIDGSGTGQVSGNVAMKRFLPSAFGYKYISSPFNSVPVSQLATYIDLNASFPTFYRYDESQTSDWWINYTNPANLLIPTQGYAANLGTSILPVTISLNGIVNNGPQSTTTLYNHNYPFTQGFNLVGNPYPSPIDWNASSGWNRSNIDNAIYYFNTSDSSQYVGTYSSYINGVSSDGIANNIIPAMQGFFIHVSNGTYPVSGSLTFSNQTRINNLNPFYHSPVQEENVPLMRFTAGFESNPGSEDPMVIYFNDAASWNFEKDYDALKLMNTDWLIPDFYAISSDTMKMSIYSLPPLVDSINVVPVGLEIEKNGWISLRMRDTENIPTNLHVYFADSKTVMIQSLSQNNDVRIKLDAGLYKNRFSLIFSLKDLQYNPGTNLNFYAYGFEETLYIYMHFDPGEKGSLVVYNMLGQPVCHSDLLVNGFQQVPVDLKPGIYVICLSSSKGTYTKKVFINN